MGCFISLCNGIGTLLHHSTSALLMVSIFHGLAFPTREIITGVLPLIMQHWIALLKYKFRGVYIVLCLSLEATFEWAVFSGYESYFYMHDFSCRWSVSMMLVAHWLYLLGAFLELFRSQEPANLPE